MMERYRKSSEDCGGVSAYTTLGTLVLSARPYESVARITKPCPSSSSSDGNAGDTHGATLQGEIFQTVDKEVCDVLMHSLASSLHLYVHVYKCINYMYTIPTCIYMEGSKAVVDTCNVHLVWTLNYMYMYKCYQEATEFQES